MIATKTIPLMVPWVPEEAVRAVSETLRTRWIGEGPKVKEFEQKFSEQIVGGRSCVATSSCTAALHLAYLLAGIGPGDEVISPLFTCTAQNEALLYCGAKIRFCDVEPNSLHMDLSHALSLVTEKTKAIVVVHYGGKRVDLRFFSRRTHGLPVIEDCAHALGLPGAGYFGNFGCFSFQAVKHVTTGDGGMLVLPDSMVDKARRMRWFGIDRQAKLNGTWENDIREVGYKYQMTDISASLGLCGLDRLQEQISYRRSLREAYVANLSGLGGILVIDQDPESACWLMTVLVERREALMSKLRQSGIECDLVHYRNDRYTIFQEFRVPGGFPNMDAVEGKYLVLPMHMGMDVGDVERICEVIRGGW